MVITIFEADLNFDFVTRANVLQVRSLICGLIFCRVILLLHVDSDSFRFNSI